MSNEGDRASVFRTTKVRTKLRGDGSWLLQRDEPKPEPEQEEKPWLAEVRARRLNGAPIETSPVSSPVKSTPPPLMSDTLIKPTTPGYLIRGVFTKLETPVSSPTSNGNSKPKVFNKKPSEGYRKIAPHTVRSTQENPEGQLSPKEQEKRTEAASNVLKTKAATKRSYVLSAAKLYEAKETSPDTSLASSSPSFVAQRVEIVDDGESTVTPAPASTVAPSPAVPPTSVASASAAKPQTAVNTTVKTPNKGVSPKTATIAVEPAKEEPFPQSATEKEQLEDEKMNSSDVTVTGSVNVASTEPKAEAKTPLVKLLPPTENSPAQKPAGSESPVIEPLLPVSHSAPAAASPAPVTPVPTLAVTELTVETEPEPKQEAVSEIDEKAKSGTYNEMKSEPEDEAVGVPFTEVKPEPEPKSEIDVKAASSPYNEIKSEPDDEDVGVPFTEAKPKPEPEPEPGAESQMDVKAASSPYKVAESEPEDKTVSITEAKLETVRKVELEINEKANSSPYNEIKSEPDDEDVGVPFTEAKPEPEPGAESEMDEKAASSPYKVAETELEDKTVSITEAKPEPKSEPAREAASEMDKKAVSSPYNEVKSQPEDEAVAVLAAKDKTQTEAKAEHQPESQVKFEMEEEAEPESSPELQLEYKTSAEPSSNIDTLAALSDTLISLDISPSSAENDEPELVKEEGGSGDTSTPEDIVIEPAPPQRHPHVEDMIILDYSPSVQQQEEEKQTDETAIETQSSADPFDPYPIETASHNSSSDLLEPFADVSFNSSMPSAEEMEISNPEATSPAADLQEPETEDQDGDQQTVILFERKSTENSSPWARWTSPTVYTISAASGEEDEEEEQEEEGEEESSKDTQRVTIITTTREIQNELESSMDQLVSYCPAVAEEERQVPSPEAKKPFVCVKEYVDGKEMSFTHMDKIDRVSLSSTCTYCGKQVGDNAKITIEHLNINCHPECFKCDVCRRPMGDLLANMFLHHKRVHCESCYATVI